VFDYNISPTDSATRTTRPRPFGDWVYLEDERGFFRVGGSMPRHAHVRWTRSAPRPGGRVGHSRPRRAQSGGGSPILPHPTSTAHPPIENRSFVYDAHNWTSRERTRFSWPNYAMGIRLVDTSNKSAPREVAFYLPNAKPERGVQDGLWPHGAPDLGKLLRERRIDLCQRSIAGFFIVEPVRKPGRSTRRRRQSRRPGRPELRRRPDLGIHAPRRQAGNGYEISFSAGAGVAVHWRSTM